MSSGRDTRSHLYLFTLGVMLIFFMSDSHHSLLISEERPQTLSPTQKEYYRHLPLWGTFQQQPGNTSPGSLYIGGRTSVSGMDDLGITHKGAPPAIYQPGYGPLSQEPRHQPGTIEPMAPSHISKTPPQAAPSSPKKLLSKPKRYPIKVRK